MIEQRKPAIDTIETLVEGVPGWSPLDQLYTLFALALTSADLPGDIVEIGSWCGRSAIALGLATRRLGRGTVHCVDLFPDREDWRANDDGTYSFTTRIGEDSIDAYVSQRVWREPFERDIVPLYAETPSLMRRFEDTIAERGLGECVHAFKGTSLHFFERHAPRDGVRLCFIDADHGFDELRRDIEIVTPHLVPGGWLCFDDAFTVYDGVDRALETAVIEGPDFDLAQQMTRKFFVARKRPA